MPQLVEQSLEDFITVFVFKIGQQTKKSTPKWHIGCLKNGCAHTNIVIVTLIVDIANITWRARDPWAVARSLMCLDDIFAAIDDI